MKIFHAKPDLSHVKSKVGSTDNLKHTPKGGKVKIIDDKVNFKETAKPRVGSLENIKHTPSGGKVKIFDEKPAFREKASPRIDATPSKRALSDSLTSLHSTSKNPHGHVHKALAK